jgi:hypothetical protein
MRRRAIVTAVAATIAVVAPTVLAPSAAQAAAYRYWSYWLGTDGGWAFANVGPAFRVPTDGTLEGWRFSVSGVEGNHSPSIAADFDSVCASTPATDGRKRVAVVVDPGLASHAPDGEQPPGAWAMCVVAEPRATGYDVLRAAVTVRTDRGLICAIGGYPARGCAEVIADPRPTATKSPTSSPRPTRSPEPTRTPPSNTAPSMAAVTATTGAPAQPAATTTPTPRTSRTSAPEPTPSVMTPTDPVDMAAAPGPVAASPSPTYSLLTSPLADPPSDGGPGGALVAGIAVASIAGLGGAAILRMRRTG